MTKGGVTQQQVENAFMPAREVTDPGRFAGRSAQVESLYLALMTEGANLAILGNRGVGKTSLARQLINLATGQNELLLKYNIRHDQQLDMLPFYYTCGNSIQTTDHLLEHLLSSADCLSTWVYDLPTARKAIEGYKPKFDASLFKLVSMSIEGSKVSEVTRERVGIPQSTVSVFTNVVSALAKENPAKDGILFVIDEFDQIRDKAGFASFLKALATNVPSARFAIVGVAHDLHDLMAEHQSADRLFASGVIPVPVMAEADLVEIIDLAQAHIGDAIVFHAEARKRVVALAQGHPYMVHLLGKLCLRTAWRKSVSVVYGEDVEATLQGIANSAADPVLEGRYTRAIQSSPQREAVLRALAKADRGGETWTSEAYPIATAAGVENPSQYVGNLVTEDYGAEIVKTRERYYRFRDSLFRAYVGARPAQYPRTPDAMPSE